MDEHGEGLIDAPKGRSANYTVHEDRLLCKTWLKIGMDPAVGTDQTKDTYWARMKEYCDANNTSENERSDRSLRSVGPSSMPIVKSGRVCKILLT